MVRPTPSNQHIYIQQKSHGNEAVISCTDSVVSGGKCGAAPKIVTPVRGQRVVVTSGIGTAAPFARLRRNSETLTCSRFANARIARASSSVTLNVNVVMLYYRITRGGNSKVSFGKNLHNSTAIFVLSLRDHCQCRGLGVATERPSRRFPFCRYFFPGRRDVFMECPSDGFTLSSRRK
jgi:hypothetical protein